MCYPRQSKLVLSFAAVVARALVFAGAVVSLVGEVSDEALG